MSQTQSDPQTAEDIIAEETQPLEASVPLPDPIPDPSVLEPIKGRPGHFLHTETGDVVNYGYDVVNEPAPVPHVDEPAHYLSNGRKHPNAGNPLAAQRRFRRICTQALGERFGRIRKSFLALKADVVQAKTDVLQIQQDIESLKGTNVCTDAALSLLGVRCDEAEARLKAIETPAGAILLSSLSVAPEGTSSSPEGTTAPVEDAKADGKKK